MSKSAGELAACFTLPSLSHTDSIRWNETRVRKFRASVSYLPFILPYTVSSGPRRPPHARAAHRQTLFSTFYCFYCFYFLSLLVIFLSLFLLLISSSCTFFLFGFLYPIFSLIYCLSLSFPFLLNCFCFFISLSYSSSLLS